MMLGRGYRLIWFRNFYIFKKTWFSSIIWGVFEPLMYLAAFGYGIGSYINSMEGISYLDFFFSGLICSTAMMISFHEATYPTFSKLVESKLYSSWLMTPVTTRDIVFGEISWATTKGFLGSFVVLLASLPFGLVKSWTIVPCLFLILMIAFIFACFGMVLTSYAKSAEFFIYGSSGILVPLTLASGVYFPVSLLSTPLKLITYLSPLFHGVEIVRGLLNGFWRPMFGIHLVFLLMVGFVLFRWAVKRIESKIVF